MKTRKSKLDLFSEQLTEWFAANKTYAEVQKFLAEKHGLSISVSRLAAWWDGQMQKRQEEELQERICRASRLTAEVEAQFAKNPAPELGQILKVLNVIILELQLRSKEEPAYIKMLPSLVGQALDALKIQQGEKKLGLDERRIKLLEARAQQAEAAQQVTESNLSPEEKQQKMRSIFGIS